MANTDFEISHANFFLKVILYVCSLLCIYAFLYTFAMEIVETLIFLLLTVMGSVPLASIVHGQDYYYNYLLQRHLEALNKYIRITLYLCKKGLQVNSMLCYTDSTTFDESFFPTVCVQLFL